jgi:hypothetical protein
LNPAVVPMLNSVTYVVTPEEAEYIAEKKEEERFLRRALLEEALNQPPPAPTGHEVGFDSFGMTGYHGWYPHHYYRYWQGIRHWNDQYYYY